MAWSQQSWGWHDSRNDWNESWYGPNRGASVDYRSRPYLTTLHRLLTLPPPPPPQTWTPPSSSSAPAVTLPPKFAPDDHHYDSTSVFGFSLKKIVEAPHWSRKKGFSARDVMDIRAHELMFHGTEEWALRLLSHGRFVSVIPTRSVAESVIMSQILSVIRKKHYDIDGTAEAIWRHVHPGKEPPSRTNEPTQLLQPMVDKIIQSVESFAPIQQGTAASQNLIKLETELEKRKQQLRQQGVMLTPERPTTAETGSATSSGHKPGDLPLPVGKWLVCGVFQRCCQSQGP